MDIGIDRIFEMLSWNNDETIQAQGIKEAKKIKNLSVFFQPIESKSIWENCAKVLSSKTDDELKLYILDLFNWLQDMNWPGAEIVYERLMRMPKQYIETPYRISMSTAERTNDFVWKRVLLDFHKDMDSLNNANGGVSIISSDIPFDPNSPDR